MRLEPAPSDDPLLSVAPQARRRREREQWQRRRRLERQLHDGAALRASALALQLGLFQHRVPEAERELRTAIGALQDELHAVLQELRDVAAQIYPPLLDETGLGPPCASWPSAVTCPFGSATTGGASAPPPRARCTSRSSRRSGPTPGRSR